MAIDQGLLDACGATPSIACRATWSWWHNRVASEIAEWVVARPFTAAVVLVIAAIVNRVARRALTSVIVRVTTSRELGVLVTSSGQRDVVGNDARQHARAATLSTVACATLSAIIWSVAALIVLGIFGIQLGPLLAGAGIAGIAVGFGAQSLVKDCIAGFFMLLEDQCGVGDEVNLDTCSGTVEDISLRITRVRGYDGTLWTVPNGTIQRVGNLSRSWMQGNVDVTIWHAADIDRAIDAIQRAADATAAIPEVADVLLQPPTLAGVERVDASGATIRLVVRTKPGTQWVTLRRFRLAVKQALDEAGVALHPPYERR